MSRRGTATDDTGRSTGRWNRSGVLVAATVVLVLGAAASGPPAAASGAITVTPNPVPVAANSYTEVEVSWTGQRPGTLVFASVCVKSTKDPDFQVGLHCSPLAQVETNGSADGSGSARLPVFRGQEPSTDLPWGCFTPDDPVPAGVVGATSCFVRVTSDVVLNNDDAVEVAVAVTGAGAPVDRGVLGAPVAAAAPTPVASPPVQPVSGPTAAALDGAPLRFTG